MGTIPACVLHLLFVLHGEHGIEKDENKERYHLEEASIGGDTRKLDTILDVMIGTMAIKRKQ